MKTFLAVIVILVLCCFIHSAGAEDKSTDPCRDKNSNAETRECYTKEQLRVNAEVDSLVREIAAKYRKDARGFDKESTVVSGAMRETAFMVMQSQRTWKIYRNQHCRAVMLSLDIGSGAGTAHEQCMFELGQARLKELRTAFNE